MNQNDNTVARDTSPGRHDHTFGQDELMPGERRTMIVIVITGAMMVVEIVAGVLFGSMALLADGLHMASHAVALVLAYFAYVYARRHARDECFSFGTGKVNALAGFTGAILLAVFALTMAWESVERLVNPVDISFDQAILVAIFGLLVNAVSAVILGRPHRAQKSHTHGHSPAPGHGNHDHNLRSAYLHVLADALTSMLAIFALTAGKFLGLAWTDPVVGIVGAALVANWSLGLMRMTCRVLLDRQGPERTRDAIREAIESDGASRVSDLHVWAIGPDAFAVMVSIATDEPRTPHDFKRRIPAGLAIVHVNVEVNVR